MAAVVVHGGVAGQESVVPPAPGGLLREGSARESVDDHLRAGGYGLLPEGSDIIAVAESIGLCGRGGAGFPSAVKMRTVASQHTAERWVVANGEEGEPGSAKDRYLMRTRPHLVLDGLVLAAAAVGAQRASVYISDPASAESVSGAIEEAALPVPVTVHRVDHTYVAGEESALVQSFAGRPAIPTDKPPRPFESGIDGLPTLVQNVETLSVLALAVRGSKSPAAAGKSFLATVFDGRGDGGLFEVEYGTPTMDLLARHGDTTNLQACLVGGLFGGVLPARKLDLALTFAAYRGEQSGLGCAAFHLIGADDCPVDVVRSAMIHLAAESARQCGACTNGTVALRDAVGRIALGVGGETDVAAMRRWAQSLVGRGACGLLDASCMQAAALLRHYEPLLTDHLHNPCSICRAHPDGDVDRLRVVLDRFGASA